MIGAVNQGLIPYNAITRYGFMIGSFIELLVFSLALGYRIKLLQEQKNAVHAQLLETERSVSEELAIQVSERTEQLSDSIEELHSANQKLQKLSRF